MPRAKRFTAKVHIALIRLWRQADNYTAILTCQAAGRQQVAKQSDYMFIEVESFKPASTSGRHGEVHIRPVPGQGVPSDLFVECSKDLSRKYPVGTRFRIKAKLSEMKGTPFLYSYYGWKYEVIS